MAPMGWGRVSPPPFGGEYDLFEVVLSTQWPMGVLMPHFHMNQRLVYQCMIQVNQASTVHTVGCTVPVVCLFLCLFLFVFGTTPPSTFGQDLVHMVCWAVWIRDRLWDSVYGWGQCFVQEFWDRDLEATWRVQ